MVQPESARSIGPSKDRKNDYKVKNLFIDVFSGNKDPLDAIKEMAEKMFPGEDLEKQAKFKQLETEIDQFTNRLEIYCMESGEVLDSPDSYHFAFEMRPEQFIEIRQTLTDMLDYLVNKYEMDIQFYYHICDYKDYIPAGENEEKKTVEKPKLPLIDIDLD